MPILLPILLNFQGSAHLFGVGSFSYLRNHNTELGRISSNLNQIAKRVNSTGNIYQEDINEVKELMNKVWRTQKSMLSKQPLIKR